MGNSNTSDNLLESADQLFSEKKFEQAKTEYESAAEYLPDLDGIHISLMLCHEAQENYGSALIEGYIALHLSLNNDEIKIKVNRFLKELSEKLKSRQLANLFSISEEDETCISYRQAFDTEIAEKLKQGFANEHVNCFLDNTNISYSDNWGETFKIALHFTKVPILIISTNMLKDLENRIDYDSDNVLKEWEITFFKSRSKRKFIGLIVHNGINDNDASEFFKLIKSEKFTQLKSKKSPLSVATILQEIVTIKHPKFSRNNILQNIPQIVKIVHNTIKSNN